MRSDLPRGWRLVAANAYCRQVVDGTHDTPAFVEEGHPLVTSRNIKDGEVDAAGARRIARRDFDEISRRSRVEQWDVLVTMIGTVGEACLVRDASPDYAIKNVGLLKCGGDEVAGAWLYYYLASPAGRQAIHARTQGSSQEYIALGELRRLPVMEPASSGEKAEIVAILRALDERIRLLRDTNATLRAMSRALFRSWFVDFDPVKAWRAGCAPAGMDAETASLFPRDFIDGAGGPIPAGWVPGALGGFAEVVDCLHARKPALLQSGHPFLQLDAIRDDGLLDTAQLAFISAADYAKWTSRIEVREGDCLITNVGRVGASAQIPPGCRAAMGRNMTALRPRAEWAFPTYLIELLQSAWMRAEIARRTDAGTVMNALNVRSIPALACVLPDTRVLQAFEAACRPLRAAMENNLSRARMLAQVRDCLLPALMAGRLRLPHAAQRAADALAQAE